MRSLTSLAMACCILAAGCDNAPSTPSRPSPIASRVSLSTFPPAALLSGSAVTVTIRVTDPAGSIVPAATVALATTAGTIPATVTTDSNGLASAVLTTASDAIVTATVSGGSGQASVPAVAPFSVRVVAPPSVAVGRAASFQLLTSKTTAVTGAPEPAGFTLACSPVPAPVTPPVGVCVFDTAGTYPVTFTARAANGWSTSDTATVFVPVVTPPAPPPLPTASITAEQTATAGGLRTYTLTARYSESTPIASCQWTFGDGTSATTSCVIDHNYLAPGQYVIELVLTPVGRDPAHAIASISVK